MKRLTQTVNWCDECFAGHHYFIEEDGTTEVSCRKTIDSHGDAKMLRICGHFKGFNSIPHKHIEFPRWCPLENINRS